MSQPLSLQQNISDDDSEDRKNRFLTANGGEQTSGILRERAASQPPCSTSDQLSTPSPPNSNFIPSSLGGSGVSPWSAQLPPTGIIPVNNRLGLPQSVPARTSSFSNSQQASFYSAMRESRAFASTFEDDESEAFSDTYDEIFIPSSVSSRGRTYTTDPSRSRSQSLATTRPGAVGSHFQGLPFSSGWQDVTSPPLNIPGARYGEIKPPGTSRYGSLGTLARSPNHIHSSSPTSSSVVGNGYSSRQPVDVSNISPFVRDVGQILLDDGSAFRDLWSGGINPPRNENGGNSGTTSRRHSVSVVQPRRGSSNIVGFSAPGNDSPDEPTRPFQSSTFGRSGLMLTDDDLASDLGMMNINPRDSSPSTSSRQQHQHRQNPPSQPASLPIYAPPQPNSPPSADRISPFQSINLTISTNSFSPRQNIGSPTDSGLPPPGNSPSPYDFLSDTPHFVQKSTTQNHPPGQQPLAARFIPGHGIQYVPLHVAGTGLSLNSSAMSIGGVGTIGSGSSNEHSNGPAYGRTRAPSYTNVQPPSPTSTRAINPQQPPYYIHQVQRRPSESGQSPLSELGKGVPLHAVPASCPLYIVEFKAGRTDLFYPIDLSLDIRVGDLVIVEADRGKDLGKVVNDSITLAEVEAFQKQQQARVGYGDGQPTSPGGNPPSSGGTSGKKEINPKKIYGKALPQDTQLLVSKIQDEVKALHLCQSKVRAKKLPMEVIDAEYQWDRRKLTFYFVAEKRIDFRELVRELFRLYKTRIWMASLQGSSGYDQ